MAPTKKDVVVGVSASGMTQFVRGALTRARRAGARIIFVTCDPGTELQTFVDLTISPVSFTATGSCKEFMDEPFRFSCAVLCRSLWLRRISV